MNIKKIKTGDIWLVNFNSTIGSEIKKERPAIVMSVMDKLPLHIVVPITKWKQRYEKSLWHVKIEAKEQNGVLKNSGADALQIKSVAEERFTKRIGKINPKLLKEIKYAIAIVLDIQVQ